VPLWSLWLPIGCLPLAAALGLVAGRSRRAPRSQAEPVRPLTTRSRRATIAQALVDDVAELGWAHAAAIYLGSEQEGWDVLGHAGYDAQLLAPPPVVLEAIRSGAVCHASDSELAELLGIGIVASAAVAVPLAVHGEAWGAVLTLAALPDADRPRLEAQTRQLAEQALAALGLVHERAPAPEPTPLPVRVQAAPQPAAMRVLVVDDDDSLRMLLRVTLEMESCEVVEAESVAGARAVLNRLRPSAIVLDIGMPGVDGLTFCDELKRDPGTADIPVILLSGLVDQPRAAGVGADAALRKPFSPLELVDLIQQVTGEHELALPVPPAAASRTQLMAYAADLRLMLELGQKQQSLLRSSYHQTVRALATALASKDTGTGLHSQRVVAYAGELAHQVAPELLDDPSLEYGFLLHDIGKIAIPDRILGKAGPLTPSEWDEMRKHPELGAELLADVDLLDGAGIAVVASHHERWDGTGYPNRVTGDRIPLAARVFAVADALDAITSDRPYRRAAPWETAVAELRSQGGRQFDPLVVDGLVVAQDRLREVFERPIAA
jgi:response regulator RpfG family c-di-GMP phosphodiesterase